MKIGTKSVLYGAHCFFIHPWFVAAGWWKLYGFPWKPWLWVAFAVHDIGYWGKPNMDGPEGEEHPRVGAQIMYWLQGAWLFLIAYLWYDPAGRRLVRPVRWWQLRRKWAGAHLAVARQKVIWGNEVMFHSRFLAKTYGAQFSRLCVADKLAICLEPAWLYLPRVITTGEVKEYMSLSKTESEVGRPKSIREWHAAMTAYMRRWVAEHQDGREDKWTQRDRSDMR